MYLEWLQVVNVRNLCAVKIEPVAGINVLFGPNGSGKTALLEAVSILGRCRSFRVAAIERVIRHQQEKLRVSAGLRLADDSSVVTGVERGRNELSIRYANRSVRRASEQAARVPIITFAPDSHRLVAGGPARRRRWLDWAMFHVEPGYLETWKSYYRALKHRNKLLRQRSNGQLAAWEWSMRQFAEKIDAQRRVFLDGLVSAAAEPGQRLGLSPLSLEYDSGWRTDSTLDQCLAEHRRKDMERGNTRFGVHRSDVLVNAAARRIGHFYSGGQVKLSLLALCLAQGRVFKQRTGRMPILLLDDLAAELDETSQERIIRELAEYDGQVFITATTGGDALKSACQKMFHVEHGCFATC